MESFYERHSHEPNNSERLSKMLLSEFEHIIKKDGTFVTMIYFLSRVSWDQRCGETPVCDKEDG
jgi:hypothetical protein